MSYNPFPESMTIREAREVLRQLAPDGHNCPVCRQMVKVYKRPIHATMARDLIHCYRKCAFDWFHFPTVNPPGGGDFPKLRYWGLIEEQPGIRDDGSTRVGWWRITPKGVNWIMARITVPRHACVYDGRLLRLEGDPVAIGDALGKKFRYDELMAGVA